MNLMEDAQGQEDLVHLISSASDEDGRRSDGVMESEGLQIVFLPLFPIPVMMTP